MNAVKRSDRINQSMDDSMPAWKILIEGSGLEQLRISDLGFSWLSTFL